MQRSKGGGAFASAWRELKDTGNDLGQKLVEFYATDSHHLLQLSIVVGTPGHDPGTIFDGWKNMDPKNPLPDITGLGDKAFSFPAGITVLKGNVVFTLTEVPLPKGTKFDDLKALTATVVQRLH